SRPWPPSCATSSASTAAGRWPTLRSWGASPTATAGCGARAPSAGPSSRSRACGSCSPACATSSPPPRPDDSDLRVGAPYPAHGDERGDGDHHRAGDEGVGPLARLGRGTDLEVDLRLLHGLVDVGPVLDGHLVVAW